MILNIFLLSLVAGLGTGLGGLIAVIIKPGKRSFGFLMGIAAGVMITLSFLELVNKAWELQGFITATIGFGAGAIFMFVLDVTIPHIRFGEEEIHHPDKSDAIVRMVPQRHGRHRFGQLGITAESIDQGLLKSGILIAIGITIHNIPEGIAVGAGYMHTPAFGLFIALAILLHNIPEGIATALPLCKSGVCRWDSFRVAFLSGLVEPVGALIAAIFLTSFQGFIPGALAFAGGVMVFIQLGLPGLQKLAGEPKPGLPQVLAAMAETVSGQLGWTQFIHGRLIRDNQHLLFRPLKYQSRLQEMAHTEAIAKIPEGLEELSTNSTVMVQVLENQQ